MRHISVDKALSYISDNYMEKISIVDLEVATGVSRYALSRTFRRAFGVPPISWLWMYRARLAASLLEQEPWWSCSAIAYQCGFETPAHFNRTFRRVFGQTPGLYRKALVDVAGHSINQYVIAGGDVCTKSLQQTPVRHEWRGASLPS